MDGSLAGCDSWFTRPASEVSAHFGIGLLGAVHQYVQLGDSSWANGVLEAGNRWPGPAGVTPNRLSVTIETEDLGNADQPVTIPQYAATLAVCRSVLQVRPSITMLVAHRVISPKTRPNCPGDRWIMSGKFAQLARDLGLQALV